jgi:23S rRNA (guanosine2251-2'-O)-methyltransferase
LRDGSAIYSARLPLGAAESGYDGLDRFLPIAAGAQNRVISGMKKRFRGPRDRAHPGGGDKGMAGRAWLYGRHAVTAALANPERRIRRAAALAETADALRDLVGQAGAAVTGEVEILDRARFEALLPRDAVHQGWALAADPLPEPRLDDLITSLPMGAERLIVLILDRVSDPHNVGAILRSAAAFAASAVIVPEHGAPAITGALAKAASGALETVPLVRVANLAQALDTLKDAQFWCLGLDSAASEDLAALDLGPRVALVLGAEGEGMRRLTRERCDVLVRLPTRRGWHSLNVSNAAAIALYEVARRGMKS